MQTQTQNNLELRSKLRSETIHNQWHQINAHVCRVKVKQSCVMVLSAVFAFTSAEIKLGSNPRNQFLYKCYTNLNSHTQISTDSTIRHGFTLQDNQMVVLFFLL